MVDEKGLDAEVADRVGRYVKCSGNSSEITEVIEADAELYADKNVKAGLADMDLLVSYLNVLDVTKHVSPDRKALGFVLPTTLPLSHGTAVSGDVC